ncbi:MAG: hypothetical protein ABJF88_12840 [Rhodothermales bacterium]
MSQFICAVSTAASSNTPAAYVLTEQATRNGDDQPGYYIRDVGHFGDDDPVETIQDLLADEEQYAGRVTVVVMGGQKMADRFGKVGLSAVPVEVGGSGGDDTLRVTEQTLVDTFEAVYRHRTVEMPNEDEKLSAVLAALYGAMSDDAGATEASPQMEALAREETTGIPTETIPEDGPKPAVPELSGSSAAVGVAKIGGDADDRTATVAEAMTAPPRRHGLEDDSNAGPASLGEHRDLALALALSCWYGEYDADELPMTDQADETARDARVREKRRRQAQDKKNR